SKTHENAPIREPNKTHAFEPTVLRRYHDARGSERRVDGAGDEGARRARFGIRFRAAAGIGVCAATGIGIPTAVAFVAVASVARRAVITLVDAIAGTHDLVGGVGRRAAHQGVGARGAQRARSLGPATLGSNEAAAEMHHLRVQRI